MSIRQVVVVRRDLNMSPGKTGAQIGHAVQQFMLDAMHFFVGGFAEIEWNGDRRAWQDTGETIIVLGCDDGVALHAVYTEALAAGLPVFVQVDEGRTEVEPNTTTCLAIGPAKRAEIDPITRHLRLL